MKYWARQYKKEAFEKNGHMEVRLSNYSCDFHKHLWLGHVKTQVNQDQESQEAIWHYLWFICLMYKTHITTS